MVNRSLQLDEPTDEWMQEHSHCRVQMQVSVLVHIMMIQGAGHGVCGRVRRCMEMMCLGTNQQIDELKMCNIVYKNKNKSAKSRQN